MKNKKLFTNYSIKKKGSYELNGTKKWKIQKLEKNEVDSTVNELVNMLTGEIEE